MFGLVLFESNHSGSAAFSGRARSTVAASLAVSPKQQREYGFLALSCNIRKCGSREIISLVGDEPPMTACGGNLIGGEFRRNKQCPHEADLRRLSLRNWGG